MEKQDINMDKREKGPAGPLFLGVFVLACLVPFIKKAFNVDDPVYIWIARHIQSSPLDFFGFNINWRGIIEPVSQFNENPPLSSYFIALAAKLFGWSEAALHMSFFIFAVAAAIGTYYLAREFFCSSPLIAALAGVVTPVFMISANTVMCDMMMTAFWVWAVFLWMRGVRVGSVFNVVLASLFIAASSLSKYVGMSLIPLLLCYSVVTKKGRWAFFLLLPALMLAGYDWLTYELYGRGLLLNAASYAVSYGGKSLTNFIVGLVFVGGCLISVFFYSFLIWPKKNIIAGALLMAAILFLVPLGNFLVPFPQALARFQNDPVFHWAFVLQFYFFALGGASALALAVSDLWRSRDAGSLLLFLWVMGIFTFLCLLNWTINGRTVLLLFPPVGILIARAFERRKMTFLIFRKNQKSQKDSTSGRGSRLLIFSPLIISLVIALAAARADYNWAGSQRAEAAALTQSYHGPGRLWFMGHWGFQYYMEALGGKPVDFEQTTAQPGDMIAIPANNCFVLPPYLFAGDSMVSETHIASTGWLAVMDPRTGAGFYGDKVSGPLPFIIASVPDEKYYVLSVIRPFPVRPDSQ
ncbi:MAG: glycosyltransferase family 39 protein [Nitrospiraceae bacterium]|nr:glycosyltransferase family 39 protein [Nitrospiraceae bacterium]